MTIKCWTVPPKGNMEWLLPLLLLPLLLLSAAMIDDIVFCWLPSMLVLTNIGLWYDVDWCWC